jgi:hypothetical protein
MTKKNVVFLIPDYSKFQIDRRIRDQAKLFSNQGYEIFLIMLGDYTEVTKQESYFIVTVDPKISQESLDRVMSVVDQSESQILKNDNPGIFASKNVWSNIPLGSFFKKIYSCLPANAKLRIRLFMYSDILQSIKRYNDQARNLSSHNHEIFDLSARLAGVVNFDSIHLLVGADLPGALAAMSLKNKYPDTPVWFDAHEYYCEQIRILELPSYESLKSLELRLTKEVDFFTCVTPDLTSLMCQDSGRTSLSLTMTNATKPLQTSTVRTIKEELGLEQQKVLLFNGGLADVRNLQKFIEIFDVAAPPIWKFVIMGYWASESLIECIERSRKTIMINPESNITLLERIRDIDAIVAPYPPVDMNTKFCFPNKMGDAIAIRKPIIINSELEFLNKLASTFRFIIPFTYGQNEIQSLRFALESVNEKEYEWNEFEEELGWVSFERAFNQIVERLE